MKIQKGDMVKILAGKDKGKTGKVISVLYSMDKVVVEGVNIGIKHRKAAGKDKPGGRISEPCPIHVSNVMYVDSETSKAVRLGVSRKNGKKERISKKSGKSLSKTTKKATKAKKNNKK